MWNGLLKLLCKPLCQEVVFARNLPPGAQCSQLAAAKLNTLFSLLCNADTLYIYDLGKVVRMFR